MPGTLIIMDGLSLDTNIGKINRNIIPKNGLMINVDANSSIKGGRWYNTVDNVALHVTGNAINGSNYLNTEDATNCNSGIVSDVGYLPLNVGTGDFSVVVCVEYKFDDQKSTGDNFTLFSVQNPSLSSNLVGRCNFHIFKSSKDLAFWGNDGTSLRTYSEYIPDDGQHVFALTRNNNILRFYDNGSLVATKTANHIHALPTTATDAGIEFCCQFESSTENSNTMQGKFYAGLAYNRLLADDEVKTIYKYLKTRYSLS